MKLLIAKMLIMKIQTFWHAQQFVYFQLFVYFSQKSQLQAFDTEIVQRKDVNENLEFVRWSAVSLLFSNKPLRYLQCLNCSKFHTEPSFTQCGRSPRDFSSCSIIFYTPRPLHFLQCKVGHKILGQALISVSTRRSGRIWSLTFRNCINPQPIRVPTRYDMHTNRREVA